VVRAKGETSATFAESNEIIFEDLELRASPVKGCIVRRGRENAPVENNVLP
jgi:hypothetical protein